MRDCALSRYQRWFVWAVVCVPVIAMTIMGTAHLVHQTRLLLADARWIVGDALAQYFERPVHVGHARLAPLGSAVIEKLDIADGRTFAGGRMISVRKLTVRYDARGVIFGGMGAAGVKSVEVVEPEVRLVRKPDGALNVMELIRPAVGPPGPPFKGRVTVTGGRISFEDRHAGARTRPPVVTLNNVGASVDAGRHPVLRFSWSATGEHGRLRSVRGIGSFDAAARTLRIDATAVGADIALLAALTGASKKLDIRSGTVDAAVGLSTRLPVTKPPTVTGTVRLNGVEAVLPGVRVPARQVSGNVLLTGSGAVLDLNGTFAGSRAAIWGSIVGFEKPEANLSVSASSVDVGRVATALGIPGIPPEIRIAEVTGVSASVGGTQAEPEARACVKAGKVSAFGLSARDVQLSAGYRGGVLNLDCLTFRLNGARVKACGQIETAGSHRIDLRGSVRDLSLGSLALPKQLAVSGTADADFAIGGSAQRPEILARLRTANASIKGFAVPALSAQLSVDVRSRRGTGRAALNAAGGLVRVRGHARPGRIDLAYSAEAIDVGALSRFLGREDIGGTAFVAGRVWGSPKDPAFSGAAEVFKGSYEDTEVDYLRTAFSGNRREVTVRDGVVRMFPAELRFAGRASGLREERLEFEGEAHVHRLQTERLSELLGRELDVTGTIAGDFTFSGAYLPGRKPEPGKLPVVDAAAEGRLRLEDGLAYGFLINTAGAGIAFRNDELTVSEAAIESGDARIVLSGTVNVASKRADLTFGLTGFDLARVRDRLESYLTVGGVAGAKGTITGPFDELTVSTSVDVAGLTLNEVQFERASFEAAYSGDTIDSCSLMLAREDQAFELKAGGVNLKAKRAETVAGRLSRVSAVDLWTMLLTSPYMASEKAKPVRDALQRLPRLSGGVVDASFELGGYFVPPVDAPKDANVLDYLNGSIKVDARQVAFDTRQIDSMVLDAVLADGAVTLNEARALAGDTYAALQPLVQGAPVYRQGKLSLDLLAANVNLAHLEPWLGENTPTGNATVEFTVAGDLKEPDVRGSVEVVNPGIHGAAFNSLRVSQINVGRERIDISDVILSLNGHQVVAQGRLPWDWKSLTIPRDKPLEFRAGLVNENLSLLNTFAAVVEPAPRTSGALIAELSASGTIADYTLSGAVKVEDGTLALKGFRNSFSDVDIDIGFDGKKVVFNKLSAQSTSGGALAVEPGGTVTVAGKQQGYGTVDLLLKANGLVLEEEDVFGLQEKVKTQLDAGISVGGTVLTPLVGQAPVTGYEPGVTISNAVLEFAIPEKKAPSPPLQLPIHPRFVDLGLTIGTNVHAKPPQMDLLVDGGGVVAGELGKNFSVGLDVTVKEGSINLYASRLRIQPGAEMVLRFQPPNPPEFLLTGFKATTSVMAAGPLGRRERYKITIAAGGNVMNLNENSITFSSDPEGLTKEQMLAALGGVQGLLNATGGDFQRELGNALRGVAGSALFRPVEKLFTEQLGFEEFAIESGAFAPLSLYLSRRLFGDFYVSFFQRLQATANVQDATWQFLFGYRFKQFYSLSVGIDNQQTASGELTFTRAISL